MGLISLLFLACFPQDSPPTDAAYYPLNEGNRWFYQFSRTGYIARHKGPLEVTLVKKERLGMAQLSTLRSNGRHWILL